MNRADAFFGAMGRGYTVSVRDNGEDEDLRAASLAAGLELFGLETPDMVCAGPLPERPAPPGVVLRQVDDLEGVRQFAAVNSAAYATYGMPPEVHPDLFDNPGAVLEDPAAHIVLASDEREPVATALVYESDGAATVQWVGTLPGSAVPDAALGHGLGHEPGLQPGRLVRVAPSLSDGGAGVPRTGLRNGPSARRIRPHAHTTSLNPTYWSVSGSVGSSGDGPLHNLNQTRPEGSCNRARSELANRVCARTDWLRRRRRTGTEPRPKGPPQSSELQAGHSGSEH